MLSLMLGHYVGYYNTGRRVSDGKHEPRTKKGGGREHCFCPHDMPSTAFDPPMHSKLCVSSSWVGAFPNGYIASRDSSSVVRCLDYFTIAVPPIQSQHDTYSSLPFFIPLASVIITRGLAGGPNDFCSLTRDNRQCKLAKILRRNSSGP